jgi:hypothetical protein
MAHIWVRYEIVYDRRFETFASYQTHIRAALPVFGQAFCDVFSFGTAARVMSTDRVQVVAKRVHNMGGDALRRATVESETYKAFTEFVHRKQAYQQVKTLATRNGTLPALPELVAAGDECERAEKLHSERVADERRCRQDLVCAHQTAHAAYDAAATYVKARPFCSVVRKQQAKAAALQQAAERASAHVASCTAALTHAQNVCIAAYKMLVAKCQALWQLQLPVAEEEDYEWYKMCDLVQLELDRARHEWTVQCHAWLLFDADSEAQRWARARQEHLQTRFIRMLEGKVRNACTTDQQPAQELMLELAAAREKLAEARADYSQDVFPVIVTIAQALRPAGLTEQFWRSMSDALRNGAP